MSTLEEYSELLGLTEDQLNKLQTALSEYIIVDEFEDLISGMYVRWIRVPDLAAVEATDAADEQKKRLHGPAIFCDIRITNRGAYCLCKNPHTNRHFQISCETNLLFRKMSAQEQIIASFIADDDVDTSNTVYPLGGR